MQTDTNSLRIHVPMELKRRGGRKLIMLPPNANQLQKAAARRDMTLVNGIAKAYHWQAIYERGKYASLAYFFEKHGLNKSYAARVMRLNLFSARYPHVDTGRIAAKRAKFNRSDEAVSS